MGLLVRLIVLLVNVSVLEAVTLPPPVAAIVTSLVLFVNVIFDPANKDFIFSVVPTLVAGNVPVPEPTLPSVFASPPLAPGGVVGTHFVPVVVYVRTWLLVGAVFGKSTSVKPS